MEKTEQFFLEKVYKAPIALVWEAITNKEHLKHWYFDFSDDFKLVPGQQFDWLAGPPDGKQWLHRGKMLEIVKGKKLSHTWEYPGYSGTSTVVWELFEIDANSTKLKFTHIFNVPFDPKEDALKRENFVEGWQHNLNIALPEFLDSAEK